MKNFQANQTYKTNLPCNSKLIFNYLVLSRTEKTATLKTDENEIIKRKIKSYNNKEFITINNSLLINA